MAARAVILGCGGPELTPGGAAVLRRGRALGVHPLRAQRRGLRRSSARLTADLRDSVGRDAPVLIDQEGGRVARLRGPDVARVGAGARRVRAAAGGDLRARAMYLRYRLIAGELRAVGIDVNCAPVLDLVRPETHAVHPQPLLRRAIPAEVAAIGPGGGRGAARRGRAAGDEAHAGAGAGGARQPPRAAGGDGGPGGARRGFRAVPGAGRPADGDDRARGLCRPSTRRRRRRSRRRWCG